ncbi:apolipoprotein N-acyltransferase [uncultured Thiodictyon sp.]|uniref:apolipoprotein N-acyltransferase n=1 Tax=uncultured Thiodictyon sp. TaxID=1846217 RepID=UPI0025D91EBF|nr:apolipoprotein N-acyltransferase [uncultured Thiodictyon sp.]
MHPSSSSLGPRLRPALPALIALAAGALTVLGFAPFSYFPVAVIALALLAESLASGSPGAGLRRGWAFGLGLMGFGIAWIRISLNQYGNMDAWAADLLMAVFVIWMASYYGLAGWLVRRLQATPSWTGPVLLLPGLYVLFEWLRGWLFTGFAWLNLGDTQIDGPLAGYAPIAGVYGLSLLTAISGGLLWGLMRWSGRGRLAAGTVLAAIWIGGAALQPVAWTQASGAPFKAAVLQANIPQAIKWEPEAKAGIVQAYWDLTKEHLDAKLILWPETAIPDFLNQVREVLIDPMAEEARANGLEIVLGIPVLEPATGNYYNALLSIGSREDQYRKRHLVPFGEFLPFKTWLGPLIKLFEVPMSDFSAGTAARPLLKVGGYTAGAAICYEDIFAAEVAQALPEAQFLIGVSNDAWFGDSLAPHQHLEMARMRALETGRDLVRATNTGISAIVDWRGRVIGQVPPFVRGSYSGPVQPRAGATPFVWVGNWLAIGLALAMVGAAWFIQRTNRRRSGPQAATGRA